MPAIVNVAGGPFAAGASHTYTGQIQDEEGRPIPAAELIYVTLSIVDTLTGSIINSVDQTDILNIGRGTVDDQGNLEISLSPDDTMMTEVPGATSVQRSLIIDWKFVSLTSQGVGRHQVNFTVVSLAGP